jgi:hypothetical protein
MHRREECAKGGEVERLERGDRQRAGDVEVTVRVCTG